MPTVRYQIRNEYGLADPELYQTADKDDPEAILEGAAMAGLVGVLRQLGDLAEFAAEIFRDLHEQVVGTTARGHGLMLRVQQLEADFPSIEKSLFSQSSHPNFAYNDGIDWHSNIQMDQNLITQGDMPRFILDSYEECCGPPRLFTLDKFDTAGAGACLKRYSDPSFFKMELVSSGLMQTYVPREKKSRKARKKGSRWKNGQTLESLLLTHANSNVQPTTSDHVLDKSAPRFVRLKSRNLNGSNENEAVKLRKCLFELHSDGHEVVFDNSRIHSTINVISDDPSELASEAHEPFVGISANHLLAGDGSPTKPAKAVKMLTVFEVNHWKKEDEALSKAQHQPFCEVEKPQISFMEKEKFADSENKSEASVYDYNLSDPDKTTYLQVVDHTLVRAEHKMEGSSDGYRTEEIGCELENFVDALNNMESEVGTDSEIKGRLELGILTKEAHEMEIDLTERLQHLETETSELNTEFSSGAVGILSVPYSDAMDISAEMPETQEKIVVSNCSANLESFHITAYNESCEGLLLHDKVANSAYLNSDEASNTKTFDNLRSDIPDESCSSHVRDSTYSLNQLDPQGSYDAVKLLSDDQHESADHKVQSVPDEIAEFFKGLTHSGSTSPPESHHAENVDELILEDMMEALEMPNGLSCSPTRNAYVEDPDRKHSLILTLPTTKEMQYSGDEHAKAFTLEDDIEASTGEGSILTPTVASAPGTSTNIVKHDGLAADLDNGHEELTLETSFDCVKGTSDILLSTKRSSHESKDDKISESHDLLCNPVKLMLEEKPLRTDLTDHVSDTEYENSVIKDFAWYTEVPEYHSNITAGRSLQLMTQEAVVDSTKTVSPPVPAVAILSNENSMMEMENIADVKNIAYLRLEVCCENVHMAKDNHAMPEVTKSQLACFSGTEESQESSNANSAEEFQKSDKVNYVEEYKKSHKLNSADESEELSSLNRAEEFQESPKIKTAEKKTLPCSESGTYSHRVMHSRMHVLNNLKLPDDINQDNPQKDMQEAKQIIHARDLPAEDFASGDETCNGDPSMLNTFELLSRLPEDNTLDAAVACAHPLMLHEIYSPRWEGIEHSNLNKSFSSGVENSALDSSALCSALPTKESSSANGVVPVEHFQAYLHTSVDETNMDYPAEVEDICSISSAQGQHESAKQDLYLSTNLFSDPARLPEVACISQASDEVDLKPKFPQYKGEYLKLDVQTTSMDVDDKQSDESEIYNHDFVNNIKYNDMEVLSLNTDMTEVLYSEALVLSECSSEASVHHLSLNVPDKILPLLSETFSLLSSCDMGECSSEVSADHSALNVLDKILPLLSSTDMGFTDNASRLSYEPQLVEATSYSSSLNLEEPPPLPPLPPLEWRSQKLQLSSLLPSDNSCEPWSGTNLFTRLPDNQTTKSILPPTFTLSKLPPIIADQRYQPDALSLDKNIVQSANASSLSSLEFEKSLCVPGAEGESKLSVVDSFTPLPIVESQISQHPMSLEERVHPTPDKRSQLDQPCPGVELMKSHHSELSHPSLEEVMPQPQNPFLDKSALEDVSHQFTSGDLRGETVHLLKSSALSFSSGLGMPQCGHVYSLAENQTSLFGVLPTTGDEWFGIKPYSIRNRPRTPLIEAVAAHDRSTLRKVPELARPSNESKDDKKELLLESNILQLRKVSEVVKPYTKPKADARDALLEQIRNKSFTLKPIVLSKPSNKSHSTDIKVAAILEKANALRQAVAGSDEEDAGDCWSDC